MVLSLLSGCPLGTSDNTTDPTNSILPSENLLPSPDIVVVSFRHLTTTESVRVEFFATNQNITDFPDALFNVENQVTQSIGFAGTNFTTAIDMFSSQE